MQHLKKILTLFACYMALASTIQAQPWSQKMAATAMQLWPDTVSSKWTYDEGLVLKGIESVWLKTAQGKYFDYIQKSTDFFVASDGSIRTYKQSDYNIDNVLPGRNLLMLYEVTGSEKYLKAATILRQQLAGQPRTKEGGFWHKERYPNQMWLDGLYMGQPFYAQYANRLKDTASFSDIANQFIWIEKHTRDAATGLLYHAWDESKQMPWANKTTGNSPNFWARSVGWYAMAIADVLEYFPEKHPQKNTLLQIFNRLAIAITKVQNKQTGLWWQVLDKPAAKGNYEEASASCMMVYALAKGARLGYINTSFLATAQKGYNGIIKNFVSTDANGTVHLNKVCKVAGLGGNPYRDGSYNYYISEPIVTDDPKGIGAFLLASVEMENQALEKIGKGKTVLLDNFFNKEIRKDAASGNNAIWHYQWDEQDNGGYYFLKTIFNNQGASTKTLVAAPTKAALQNAAVYILVDPDVPKENPSPNYINEEHINAITNWVKAGGTLVLLGNDSGNVEFEHFNQLAGKFGIHFNADSKNKVPTTADYSPGQVIINKPNPVFKKMLTDKGTIIYIKEYSSLLISPPAKAIINHQGLPLMAIASYGKGKVFALGDPWIYNEYVDGRRLPANYQNFEAANQWVQWLLK